MEAKELRIGNLYDNNGRVEKVTPNTILEVWESERSWCKPIPLTEDWLLKAGFKNNDTYPKKYKFVGDFAVMIKEDGIYYEDGYGFESKIKTVNRLQNIFHALTGEELTFKM